MAEIVDLGGAEESTDQETEEILDKIKVPKSASSESPDKSKRPLEAHGEPEILDLCCSDSEDEDAKSRVKRFNDSSGDSKSLPAETQNQCHDLSHIQEVKGCFLECRDRVRPGTLVELEGRKKEPQVFLLVLYVLKDTSSHVPTFKLRGLELRRNEDTDGMLPHGNSGGTEVHLVMKHCANLRSLICIQALQEIDAERASRVRTLILTNHIYPRTRNQSDDMLCNTRLSRDILVCRWTRIFKFEDQNSRTNDHVQEWSLQRLDQRICDPGYAFSDFEIWRSAAKGTRERQHNEQHAVNIKPETSSIPDSDREISSNCYTSGEGFCGAGGASQALKAAGFKSRWAFDSWNIACKTHDKNFPEVKTHEMPWKDFAQTMRARQQGRVDLLHLSPHFKFGSNANTCGSHGDLENIDCFLATGEIVDLSQCRILTLEVSDNILSQEHVPHFRIVLGQLTARNFSVCWKVVHMDHYGCVHDRKRLILFAAGPGEVLPEFPKRTHGDPGLGYLAPITINSVLTKVRATDDLHNVKAVVYCPSKRKAKYDGDQPLRNHPPKNGTANYHPSGERRFSLAELRDFQGFYSTHYFEGTPMEITVQINNDLSGNVFVQFVQKCKEALQRSDRKYKKLRDTTVFPQTPQKQSNIRVGPLTPPSSLKSKTSTTNLRKRRFDHLGGDDTSPMSQKKARVAEPMTSLPYHSSSIDTTLSHIPDGTTREKVNEILSEFPQKPVTECVRALEDAHGNLVRAVKNIVIGSTNFA
ncbi:MAG: hypothetical protein M1820_002194 [Bogoriella megaspora]|nr:MAG: hypothetical protein M1820_002194 [Bogoriella megaspora]